MDMLIPHPLKPGGTIGVMAPASYIEKADIEASKAVLEGLGYTVIIHPQTHARLHQSAGDAAQKRDAFHELLMQPKIDAVLFAAGGNRSLHWADTIDWNLVRAHPKPVMGFSDTTSLLNIITSRAKVATYHGPTLRWFMTHDGNKTDITQCLDILSQSVRTINLDGATVQRAGGATGPLIGGNASLVQYLLTDMDFKNAILFLEDWNIETSRLDLLFRALKRAHVFDKISGLILGQFDNLQDTGRPFGFSFEDIVAEHTGGHDFPILMNAPFGHGERLVTLPVGQNVTLDGTTLALA